jgi:hypothetical protein
MIYGLGSIPDCLSLKFGDVRLMSNVSNISLWGIRGKPKDIIFIIKLRAKCLSLTTMS